MFNVILAESSLYWKFTESRFLRKPVNRVARKIWGKVGKLRTKHHKFYINYPKIKENSKIHKIKSP